MHHQYAYDRSLKKRQLKDGEQMRQEAIERAVEMGIPRYNAEKAYPKGMFDQADNKK